jgi:hypothetical protein
MTHIRSGYRVKGLFRPPKVAVLLAAVAVAVCCLGAVASAQTDYSLRMRTLGLGLSGIVDDPFNDAFLNPARVADLGGRQFYAGRLPQRGFSFVYPDYTRWTERSVFPPERVPGDPYNLAGNKSYTPYTLGFVTPLGGSLTSSIALEAAVRGDERLDVNQDLDVVFDPAPSDFHVDQGANADEDKYYHFVFDAAFGTGSPESEDRRFGVRATVFYDRVSDRYINTSTDVEPDGSDLTELEMRSRYERRGGEVEELDAAVTLGVFLPTHFVRQGVVGVSGNWSVYENDKLEQNVTDEDFDGNGSDPDGGVPYYSVDKDRYDSRREYSGGALFGRLGLSWAKRLRSFHRLTWSQSSGDGDGEWIDQSRVTEHITEKYGLDYSYQYDGTISSFDFKNAIGFFDRFTEDVLFAAGIEAVIARVEFDETGVGTGAYKTSNNGTSTRTEAPYEQKGKFEREIWRLQIPTSVEWEINRYVTWRLGVIFEAVRQKDTGKISRDLDLQGIPDMGLLPISDEDHDLNYRTSTYVNNGLAITLWDRLSVDLYASSSVSTNLLYFTSALIDFRF